MHFALSSHEIEKLRFSNEMISSRWLNQVLFCHCSHHIVAAHNVVLSHCTVDSVAAAVVCFMLDHFAWPTALTLSLVRSRWLGKSISKKSPAGFSQFQHVRERWRSSHQVNEWQNESKSASHNLELRHIPAMMTLEETLAWSLNLLLLVSWWWYCAREMWAAWLLLIMTTHSFTAVEVWKSARDESS